MNALIYNQYGGPEVLKLEQIEHPVVSQNNAIVRVKAFSVNPRDTSLRDGTFKIFTGSKFPKLTAADFSGVIEDIGVNDRFKKGDEVFGYVQDLTGGVSAELVSVPAKYLAKKPAEIDHALACTLGCAYLTALQGLRDKLKIKPGDKLVVFGASGGVGTAVIQLAKILGAKVCAISHSKNEAYCREVGADVFKAYDKDDPFSSTTKYDAFFQVFSKHGDVYSRARNLLRTGGRFLCLIPSPLSLVKKVITLNQFEFMLVRSSANDLEYLASLVKSGKLLPAVTQRFTMAEAVDAYNIFERGGKTGKIVVEIK